MKTLDFTSQAPVPVPDDTKFLAKVDKLSKEITSLFSSITGIRRKLKSERMKAGQLLLELREHFAVKDKNGAALRGPRGGAFCKHCTAQGWNLGTCYSYIAEVEGRKPHSPVRLDYWAKMNRQMKQTAAPRKIHILQKAIEHMIELYKIPVTFTLTPIVTPRLKPGPKPTVKVAVPKATETK